MRQAIRFRQVALKFHIEAAADPAGLEGFETLLRDLTAGLPGVAELDCLVCDGKTLRGSLAETNSGAAKFIGQLKSGS